MKTKTIMITFVIVMTMVIGTATCFAGTSEKLGKAAVEVAETTAVQVMEQTEGKFADKAVETIGAKAADFGAIAAEKVMENVESPAYTLGRESVEFGGRAVDIILQYVNSK